MGWEPTFTGMSGQRDSQRKTLAHRNGDSGVKLPPSYRQFNDIIESYVRVAEDRLNEEIGRLELVKTAAAAYKTPPAYLSAPNAKVISPTSDNPRQEVIPDVD